MANTLFSKQQLALKSTGLALFAAIVFMVVDKQNPDLTAGIREHVHAAMSPLYGIAEKTRYAQVSVSDTFTTKESLQRENIALKAKLAQANTYLQKYADLSAENARLRGLLNAPTALDGRVDIAAVIGIDNNPLRQTLVLNRGKNHGMYVGQTVLDEAGLMGQLINVYPNNSRAMLISDAQHSLAVKVKRTGMRAVVSGNGDSTSLNLQYVPNTADIQVGDKILSTGLGQRFPAGYMVGEVSYVDHIGKHEFLEVRVKPSANLQDDKYVMLLSPTKPIRLNKPQPLPEDGVIFSEDILLEADFAADHQSNTLEQTPATHQTNTQASE